MGRPAWGRGLLTFLALHVLNLLWHAVMRALGSSSFDAWALGVATCEHSAPQALISGLLHRVHTGRRSQVLEAYFMDQGALRLAAVSTPFLQRISQLRERMMQRSPCRLPQAMSVASFSSSRRTHRLAQRGSVAG